MKREEIREAVTLTNEEDKIFGIVHRPIGLEKCPAILFCQGFAGNKCGKLDIYVSLAQALSQKGFIVLRFDYRGCGDSEGDSKKLGLKDKVSDTLCALEFLKRDPQVDTVQIGIFGRSLGGAIALLAAQQVRDIKSLVLWAPVFNGVQWRELWNKVSQNPNNLHVQEELKKIPGEVPNPQFLQQLFNLDVKEALKECQPIPLLHIHGGLDSVVKEEHALLYQQECHSFRNSKFMRLAKADHDFATSSDRGIAEKETIEWFCHSLKN